MSSKVSLCGFEVKGRLEKQSLFLVSILAFADILSHYLVGFLLVFQGYLSHRPHFMMLTAGMFLHLLLFGGWASLTPRKELRGKDRHRLMKSQGGHSVMLAYFCGFGTLAEYVRLARDEGGGKAKLIKAARLHAFGFSIAKMLCSCTVFFAFNASDRALLATHGFSMYVNWSFGLTLITFFTIMGTREVSKRENMKSK